MYLPQELVAEDGTTLEFTQWLRRTSVQVAVERRTIFNKFAILQCRSVPTTDIFQELVRIGLCFDCPVFHDVLIIVAR